MKKILLLALSGIMYAELATAQTTVYIGNAQFITDTSAHFQPYVYNNTDTVNPSTVWVKFLSPIADSVSATLVLPRNFSFNFDYYGFICGSTQTYSAGFRNSDTTVYGGTQSVTLLPCTDINEPFVAALAAITIAPMPVTDQSECIVPVQNGTLMIYTLTGQIVQCSPISDGRGVINKGTLAPGIYLVVATDTHGIPIARQKCSVK